MYKDYFESRGVKFSKEGSVPPILVSALPKDKLAMILDIGCGGGTLLFGLKEMGYTNLYGIDLEPEAVEFCRQNGINCELINVSEYLPSKKYDFIVMNHVLEHIKKEQIIEILIYIKQNLLSENGILYISVPNAQSNTGCYWAYEDFTHNTLFTSGSLLYVLSMAGFKKSEFLDIDGYEGSNASKAKKLLCKMFLVFYKFKINFWNRVTASYFHKPSPQIFTYELKIVAYNKL